MSKYNDNSESYFAESAKHGVQNPPKAREPLKVTGRLAQFIDTWKVLTGDTWILNTIKGYAIPLKGKPLQSQRPLEGVFSKEQTALLKEEIKSLLEKGAISHCRETSGFFSTIFLAPKKNGQLRPVINLKHLNHWVESPHFKMEGIPTLRDLIRQGDWMVKVDLKDAYFTIPIHPHHQPLLRFVVEKSSIISLAFPSVSRVLHGHS